jgi:alpha-D-xyloside xylohydrolase
MENAPMPLTQVTEIELTAACVRWTAADESGATRSLRISRPTPNVWRLQMADTDGRFDNRGACQVLARELREELDVQPAEMSLAEKKDGACTLSAEGCSGKLTLNRDPMWLTFHGADGGNRLDIDLVADEGGAVRVSGPLGHREKLYGTGQRFNAVNQRGKHVEAWAEDRWCQTEGNSYVPVPFVLSTEGYGWLVNRFEGMEIDLDADEPGLWTVSALRAPLDLYVFVDDDPRAILGSLAKLGGHAPVPPEWAFGMLVSRHGRTQEFSTPEGVLEMAAKMDELDLPWSAVILEGWPTFDAGRYPELHKLTETLHAQGKKVMVYEACGRVRANLCDEVEGSERYCVKMADGSVDLEETRGLNPADAPDRRASRWVDITDPEAWDWWAEKVWGRLLNSVGIDGAKIDFCEQFPEHDGLKLADGRDPRGMHHYYPTKYNTLMYRLFNSKRAGGGVCWSRGGGIGAARYPWAWCGDQLREWDSLQAILRAALSAGLSGVPFMGHDLGGYMPSKDPDVNPEPDVFARSCAFACFNPMMSTHGTVTRPYDFEPEIVDLYRLYSKIHYALIPYLVEQAHEGCAAGLPMMRHLVLHCPNDKIAAECEDEFFLGEDLLVAPVFRQADTRTVYLPSGTWEGLFNGMSYRGPCQLASFPTPLNRIPVFARRPASSAVLPEIIEEIRTLAGEDHTAHAGGKWAER